MLNNIENPQEFSTFTQDELENAATTYWGVNSDKKLSNNNMVERKKLGDVCTFNRGRTITAKDAVDGEICGEWRNQEDEQYELYAESYEIDNSKFKIGDKVKIIIVKEE